MNDKRAASVLLSRYRHDKAERLIGFMFLFRRLGEDGLRERGFSRRMIGRYTRELRDNRISVKQNTTATEGKQHGSSD